MCKNTILIHQFSEISPPPPLRHPGLRHCLKSSSQNPLQLKRSSLGTSLKFINGNYIAVTNLHARLSFASPRCFKILSPWGFKLTTRSTTLADKLFRQQPQIQTHAGSASDLIRIYRSNQWLAVLEISWILAIPYTPYSALYRSIPGYLYLHWASKEIYFFRATLTKIQSIKMYHIWIQVQISKDKRLVEGKRSKMGWNRKRSFFKYQKKSSSPGHGARHGQKPVQRYNITRHSNWINSYWMFWIGGLSWRFSVSSFCDFWKNFLLRFHRIFSFLAKATFWLFRCAS